MSDDVKFQIRVNTYPDDEGFNPQVLLSLIRTHAQAPLLVDIKAHGWPGRSYEAARDLARMFSDVAGALDAYAESDPGVPYTGMTPVVPQPQEPFAESQEAAQMTGAIPKSMLGRRPPLFNPQRRE